MGAVVGNVLGPIKVHWEVVIKASLYDGYHCFILMMSPVTIWSNSWSSEVWKTEALLEKQMGYTNPFFFLMMYMRVSSCPFQLWNVFSFILWWGIITCLCPWEKQLPPYISCIALKVFLIFSNYTFDSKAIQIDTKINRYRYYSTHIILHSAYTHKRMEQKSKSVNGHFSTNVLEL